MSMNHNNNNTNYPTLALLPSVNSNLYQQPSMMNMDPNQSPTCFQNNYPHGLDLIKLETSGTSSHIVRALNGDSEKNNNNKALDLELKQHHRAMSAL